MPVTAYLDAAYNHPQGRTATDPRIHTLAAYLADQADWKKLRKEWREQLRCFGVPYFHLKDFEYARNVVRFERGQISSKSCYLGWSAEKFALFERRLHAIINRKRADGAPRITALSSALVVSDYEEVLPEDLKQHPRFRSAFMVNVANLMEGIADWAKLTNCKAPIHYIFAGGDQETGNLDLWFSRLFERDSTIDRFRLGKGFSRLGYDIQWMKSEPALQMVDCPAYELNRAIVEWAKRNFTPILKSELRDSLSSLCRIDHGGATLRKPDLLELFITVRINDAKLEL